MHVGKMMDGKMISEVGRKMFGRKMAGQLALSFYPPFFYPRIGRKMGVVIGGKIGDTTSERGFADSWAEA